MEDNNVLENNRLQLILSRSGRRSGAENVQKTAVGPSEWKLSFEQNETARKQLVLKYRNEAQSHKIGFIGVLAWSGKKQNGTINWVQIESDELEKDIILKPGTKKWRFNVSAEKYWKRHRVTKFQIIIIVSLTFRRAILEDWNWYDWPANREPHLKLHFEEDGKTLYLNKEYLTTHSNQMAGSLRGSDDDDERLFIGFGSYILVLTLNILNDSKWIKDINVIFALNAARILGFNEAARRCMEFMEARQETNPVFAAAVRLVPQTPVNVVIQLR